MSCLKKRRLLFLIALPLLLLRVVALYGQTSTSGNGKSLITHSFFVAGPDFTGIIGEAGEVIWNSEKAGARDGYVLPDGHILICWGDEVKEFNNKKQVIFSFKRSSDENELGTAVRLENGHTLITESGKNPVLMEVNQQGKINASITLQPETDNIHMQTRMARKLPNGNYLVPHLLAFAVKEYSPAGKVLKTFTTDLPELGGKQEENWPFTAIRLKNGNTLVTLTHGNKVVEFNQNGNVVWKISNDDLTEQPFSDPCGAQRLPNGNTVIASYGATAGIKLFEVTRDKKMIWHYDGYRVHDFQVLSTNGIPLTGKPLK